MITETLRIFNAEKLSKTQLGAVTSKISVLEGKNRSNWDSNLRGGTRFGVQLDA